MSIAFIGDVHRSFHELATLVASFPADVEAIIQLGDLGLEPPDLDAYPPALRLTRPVHYIDGNWDYFGAWRHLAGRTYRQLTAPVEMLPNLIYVPAGTVFTLAGRRIGFLGGAESRTQLTSRHPGLNWWPGEEPVPDVGVARLLHAALHAPIDLLVTHQPPVALLRARLKQTRGYSASAVRVQAAWDALGRPPLLAGHIHQSRSFETAITLEQLQSYVIP